MIDSNTSLILGEGKCKYAFFPGCCLCENEPEIVVKAYDSLRFQKTDTALVILHCGDIEDVETAWDKLGQPEMILCCPRCAEFFGRELPHIPVVSLYDKLMEYGISGGCNSVDYCLHETSGGAGAGDAFAEGAGAVAELAESMGATLHPHEENSPFPYLVNDIAVRNRLKSSNYDAAHILELVYGMGASNTHLIHEHDHEHEDGHSQVHDTEHEQSRGGDSDGVQPGSFQNPADCDGNCSVCGGCAGQPEPPQPLPDETRRRANLEELVQVLQMLY